MISGLTVAHLLTALAAAAALVALMQYAAARRHAVPGTPGYARARDARRYAVAAGGAALILFALAWLTPFGPIVLY